MCLQRPDEDVPCALPTVDVDVADGTGPKRAWPLFQFIDDGADHSTWASRDGTAGEHRFQGFSTAKLGLEGGRDVAHEMLDVGVGFHVKAFNVDAPGLGHLREVVAHQIHKHPVLCSLFLIADHGLTKLGGLIMGAPLRARAFDRGRLQPAVLEHEQGLRR